VDEGEGTCDVIYDDDCEEDGVALPRVSPAPRERGEHAAAAAALRAGCLANAARCLLRVARPAAAAAAATAALRAGAGIPPVRASGAGGLTREVETPLPSNSPHEHMILRVELVGSHGRWKRPCLQTAHMTI
jgi:hypothetical protein